MDPRDDIERQVQDEVHAWFKTPLGQEWEAVIEKNRGRVSAWDESFWIWIPVTNHISLTETTTSLELMPRYTTRTSMQFLTQEMLEVIYQHIWGMSFHAWHPHSAYRWIYLGYLLDK
jgi:hypothetical protein